MDHAIDPSVALLGLPGFALLELREEDHELVCLVETTATRAWCASCGVRAHSKGRATVTVRHLPSGGRPVRLCWRKRVWCCREEGCANKTWRERSELIAPRAVLTEPARAEACEQVGRHAHPVSEVAGSFGVGWHTVMRAVEAKGSRMVEGRDLGSVTTLGLDETLFSAAGRGRRAGWCTGFCDLDRAAMIDLVRERSRRAVERWLGSRDERWRAGVAVVALDPHAGYAAAVRRTMGHARLVLDPFHCIALANRCIDDVRRRTQNEVFGHRGRTGDPLYGIRRLLLVGEERLNDRGRQRLETVLASFEGDPWCEVWSAWRAKEALRQVYAAPGPASARRRLRTFHRFVDEVDVPEVSKLARTIRRWEQELLAYFSTGASNGITEALNALVKKIKRIGHGFRNFENYRLRVLLYCGGVAWDTPSTVKLRTRVPA